MNVLVQWGNVLLAPAQITKVLLHFQHPESGQGAYVYLAGGGNPIWFAQADWDAFQQYLQDLKPGDITTKHTPFVLLVGKPGGPHEP